jgi:hypothetical protein
MNSFNATHYQNAKSWPFEEAQKILKRIENKPPTKGFVLLDFAELSRFLCNGDVPLFIIFKLKLIWGLFENLSHLCDQTLAQFLFLFFQTV